MPAPLEVSELHALSCFTGTVSTDTLHTRSHNITRARQTDKWCGIGHRLVMAADAAIAEALKVGETTRARLAAEEQAANSMEDVDDPMQGTPPKSRKKRWGRLM